MIRILYAAIDEQREEDFEECHMLSGGEYEIVLFETCARLGVSGELRECPKYTCVLCRAGENVCFRAAGSRLVYSVIRFQSDETLLQGGFLPFGAPVVCADYSGFKLYWQAVLNEWGWDYGSSPYAVTSLMHIIFERLSDYAYEAGDSGYRKSFLALREQIYQYPERQWTLEEMAGQVRLGTRSLQKFYKNFFGISCMNEVIRSRVNRAKLLLSRTGKSISEISQQCGYNNWEHFSRQFKSRVGMTPTQYRMEKEKRKRGAEGPEV